MGTPDFRARHSVPRRSRSKTATRATPSSPASGASSTTADPDEIDRERRDPRRGHQGARRARRLRHQDPAPVRRPRPLPDQLLARRDDPRRLRGNLTALLSAHQSIGVPQPLIVFGTDEQKRNFLPRCADGEISAFALTEPDVGSDPARMKTTATPDRGRRSSTSSTAKNSGAPTASGRRHRRHGQSPRQGASPPSSSRPIARRRDRAPLPLHGAAGALQWRHPLRPTCACPRENIILAEGQGLKVALTTLNTGRLTLPAACTGAAKRCLEIARDWASERVQWGSAIGKHAAIAEKIARMAADTFAMESMTPTLSALVDADKQADIRLEAAMAKLWGTERGWRDHRRHHADPRRPRLRNRRLAARRAARSPSRSSASCATPASTPSSRAPARSCASSSPARRSTRT